ncbi:MAG: M48 family metalloprotease [Alphaproteobacteria bacterium]|nr:M48 family metalloprotease [Alphaproteobacteria bacterium]
MLYRTLARTNARRANRYYYINGAPNAPESLKAGVDVTKPVIGPITGTPIPDKDLKVLGEGFDKLAAQYKINPRSVHVTIQRRTSRISTRRSRQFHLNAMARSYLLDVKAIKKASYKTPSVTARIAEGFYAPFREFQGRVSIYPAMVEICNPRELAIVSAHELSHIKNRDWRRVFPYAAISLPVCVATTAIMTKISELLPGSSMLIDLTTMYYSVIFGSVASHYVMAPHNHAMEFRADLDAVKMTLDPAAAISYRKKMMFMQQLEKETSFIGSISGAIRRFREANGIVRKEKKKAAIKETKTSRITAPTHPTSENRIKAIEAYANEQGMNLDDIPQSTELNKLAFRRIIEKLKRRGEVNSDAALARLRPETRKQLLAYAGLTQS